MGRKFRPYVAIAVMLLPLATHHSESLAAPLLSSSAGITDNYRTPDGGFGSHNTQFCSDSGAGLRACQGADLGYVTPGLTGDVFRPFSFFGNALNYNANAVADYGVLKSYAELSIQGTLAAIQTEPDPFTGLQDTRDNVTAQAFSGFRDQWTISGMPDGSTGTLQLTFQVTGTASGSTSGSLSLSRISPTGAFSLVQSAPIVPNTDIVLSVPFAFANPLDFRVQLGAAAFIHTCPPFSICVESPLGQQSSLADFSHTATLSAIVARDGVGNIVPFSLSTASNAAIFNDLTAVPIPGAVWLFGSGLLGLVGALRPRKATA